MRSYSFFTIVLLCIGILIVDLLAYYWLRSITKLITADYIKKAIHILFWVFTVGLIAAILILKWRLEYIVPEQKQQLISGLYGLAISSFLPKLIFVIVISILFFANKVLSESASLIVVPLAGLLSGVLPFLFVVYGITKARYDFKVDKIAIELEGMPHGFEGLKLVHISDLHIGGFNFNYAVFDRAIKLINELNPDYIFFTGDLVNNFAWELDGWDSTFNKLSARKGKYAVLGNHDYGDYSQWQNDQEKEKNFENIKAFYQRIGFKLLLNDADVLWQEEGSMAIIGVENWGAPPFKQYGNLSKALDKVADVPFKILLSHDPTHWPAEVVEKTDIALTLSGHTHGMQAGINLKNIQWSPIKYKYKHWAGLYKNADQYLYVNRGLGWIGFPGRLGMRPEITLLELN